jgi:hypothetical protein
MLLRMRLGQGWQHGQNGQTSVDPFPPYLCECTDRLACTTAYSVSTVSSSRTGWFTQDRFDPFRYRGPICAHVRYSLASIPNPPIFWGAQKVL